MSQIKYLVVAGYVQSKHDGQRHFINCNKLIQLYQVYPEECICIETNDPALPKRYREIYGDLIKLVPKYNGDYSIPKGNKA